MERATAAFATLAVLLLTACAGQPATQGAASLTPALASAQTGAPPGVAHALSLTPSLTVRTFAASAALSKPDPIVLYNGYVYVAYQNASGATGGGTSTIVQYAAGAKVVHTLSLSGRCDGMRENPYTHDFWATVNEDGNSSLYVFSPTLTNVRHYAFSAATHGGGYDDLAFVNGMAFAAASNPTLNAQGQNTHPALVSITLSGATATVKPVLYGNAQAADKISGSAVTLNLTDPDSLAVSPTNQLVLVSQADSEIIYLTNPGTSSQRVVRLQVGTQLDDIAWATEPDGLFYVADAKTNTVYSVSGQLATGTLYVEAPSDSGVAGFVGTLDESTGTVTPVVTGFSSPTGLIFVSDRD